MHLIEMFHVHTYKTHEVKNVSGKKKKTTKKEEIRYEFQGFEDCQKDVSQPKR
jgi:hypothetical protein